LSIKAETNEANTARITTAQRTLGIAKIIKSAILWGILDSEKNATKPIVPEIIKSTFQSMAFKTSGIV